MAELRIRFDNGLVVDDNLCDQQICPVAVDNARAPGRVSEVACGVKRRIGFILDFNRRTEGPCPHPKYKIRSSREC